MRPEEKSFWALTAIVCEVLVIVLILCGILVGDLVWFALPIWILGILVFVDVVLDKYEEKKEKK